MAETRKSMYPIGPIYFAATWCSIAPGPPTANRQTANREQ